MSLTLPMTAHLTTSAVACGEDGIDEESESANDPAVSGLVCHDHNKSTFLRNLDTFYHIPLNCLSRQRILTGCAVLYWKSGYQE